jgi:hypothetical protein
LICIFDDIWQIGLSIVDGIVLESFDFYVDFRDFLTTFGLDALPDLGAGFNLSSCVLVFLLLPFLVRTIYLITEACITDEQSNTYS